jgi:lipopolysaccharide export system protein LptA
MTLSTVKFFLSLSLILPASTVSWAMSNDREKVAELSADTANLDQQTHRGEYTGHVEFNQGTSHLRAAKAITQGSPQNKLILAIALGNKDNQAHYWTQTEADKPLLHAYADKICYYPERHLIELMGHAHVSQGDNSFSGPKISYDTEKQHVISKGKGKNRTLIIIHPEKKT